MSRPWMIIIILISISLAAFWKVWPFRDEQQFIYNSKHLDKEINFNTMDENNNNIATCETIHVAMVCGGYKSTRALIPMLKSILFYRKNPINFHIMVDDISYNILDSLFNTWNLPDVSVNFYQMKETISLVSWIPNIHYSGIFGMLKLTLPNVLSENIHKVILLDTDLLFMADIVELWTLFEKMNSGEVSPGGLAAVIGMVENQSDWYLGNLWKDFKPWPAVGRGFNAGVTLLHLDRLRKMKWQDMWETIAKENLLNHKGTSLADQDVLNALIKQRPNLIYEINCEWNVQLSDHTRAENCYSESKNGIKVIHWNSPRKYKVKLKNIKYFQSVYKMFLGYDGNILKNKLIHCKEDQTTEEVIEMDICHSFRAAHTAKWRTHIYYMEFEYLQKDNFDVTLVAQLSMDRLQFLEELSLHWEGPMSIALYLSDAEIEDFTTFIDEWSETLKMRKNIAYHLVFKEGTHFPVNYLRNVALKNSVTPYVFLTDIDFLPMFGIYEYLKQSIQLINPGPSKKALVIPAFETQRYRNKFPRNKVDVVRQLAKGNLFTFRYHVWRTGHAPTDFKKWKDSDVPYNIDWQPDYEPYIVAHRTIPSYDTRFTGFGWNKVSHVMEMHAQNYTFVVLPSAFIVHMPHAPSMEINKFRNSTKYRMCLKQLKEEFIQDLNKKYGAQFISNKII